eukprot:scaffold49978_cov63-Phaeocystis_antarctica.AAC.1
MAVWICARRAACWTSSSEAPAPRPAARYQSASAASRAPPEPCGAQRVELDLEIHRVAAWACGAAAWACGAAAWARGAANRPRAGPGRRLRWSHLARHRSGRVVAAPSTCLSPSRPRWPSSAPARLRRVRVRVRVRVGVRVGVRVRVRVVREDERAREADAAQELLALRVGEGHVVELDPAWCAGG